VCTRGLPKRALTKLARPQPKQGLGVFSNPMALIPIVCFGLGYWQFKRRIWKLELIKAIEGENSKAPAEFDPSHDYIEYARVKTRGVYDYDYEWFIGPRHELTLEGEMGKPGGYHTVVPMQLSDGTRVLVDRGWLPHITEKTVGIVKGTVDIVGRIRGPEKEVQLGFKKLHPEATVMVYRASDVMAAQSNSLPVTIELESCCDVEDGPYGGQTRTEVYNKHLEYIITWWGLAFVSLFFVFSRRRVVKVPKVFK